MHKISALPDRYGYYLGKMHPAFWVAYKLSSYRI